MNKYVHAKDAKIKKTQRNAKTEYVEFAKEIGIKVAKDLVYLFCHVLNFFFAALAIPWRALPARPAGGRETFFRRALAKV